MLQTDDHAKIKPYPFTIQLQKQMTIANRKTRTSLSHFQSNRIANHGKTIGITNEASAEIKQNNYLHRLILTNSPKHCSKN